MSGRRRSKKTISEQIAEQVKQSILQGDLCPGDKLPALADMAHEYGVSRSAMREAFSALQAMGLVQMKHGEGTFVTNLDMHTNMVEPMNAALLLGMNELRNLHEVRTALELCAVKFAALRRTDEQIQMMQLTLSELELVFYPNEVAAAKDWALHLQIAECSQNLVLYNLMSTLSAAMTSMTNLILPFWEVEERQNLHWNLFDAIVEQNGRKAESCMQDYLGQIWNCIEMIRISPS